MVSFPAPPEMKSLPPKPLILSSPPRPMMQSLPSVPSSLSALLVPTITWVPSGQQLGSSARLAVINWVFVVIRPAMSVAFQVTVVFPRGNVDGASLVIVGVPPHESVAVAVPMLGLLHEVIVLAGGTVSVGGVVP